jgi:hypothetical protein
MNGSVSAGTHHRRMVELLIGMSDHRGSIVKHLGAAMPIII